MTTRRDYFENIISTLKNEESVLPVDMMIAFCEKEIEQLNTRNNRAREKTATKSDGLKDAIYNLLTGEPQSIPDILGQIEDHFEATAQKVSSRLATMVKAGEVTKAIASAGGRRFNVYFIGEEPAQENE